MREECRTAILHDDMTLAHLWFMLNPLRILKFVGFIETWRGFLQVNKVNLGSSRRLQLKMNQRAVRWNLRKKVLLKLESLHVLLVEISTVGNVYWLPGLALDVVKMDRKWEIVLLEKVRKLLLMFQKMIVKSQKLLWWNRS